MIAIERPTTMTEPPPQLSLASPELEDRVKNIFPFEEISPEEFAGRDGEGWTAFSFDAYRYQNEKLDAWIKEFGKILATPGAVEIYQMKYLTPQERARLTMLKQMIEDDF